MRRLFLALGLSLAAGPARAHDAFGDLGPFYASLLHPLADPMQAALVIGTAAFLAGRALGTVGDCPGAQYVRRLECHQD